MLSALDVLVLDCQSSGATPAHGDLLELGWAVTGASSLVVPVQARWIVPATRRPVSRPVRQLTGWSEACVADSIAAADAWSLLLADATRAAGPVRGVPTVIHFARFELGFLRALHEETSPSAPFPLDTVCLHAIAQRLFPDLPRRNLRALAGNLGHSPELVRRSAGHVEATAFIWRAILPKLEEMGVTTWEALGAWLDEPAPSSRAKGPDGKKKKLVYPLAPEKRRALPDVPGVYRFKRPNGDVLYVGKAASLKKRVASHFVAGTSRATERALEMLSQAHDIEVTPTASILEAALLETDEIKRLDPPYNVQLRAGDRHAWFASVDWRSAAPVPDDVHRVGPLPSRRALAPLGAVKALLEGDDDEALPSAALGVPRRFGPEGPIFRDAWVAFARDHLGGSGTAAARILRAAARIVPVDGPDDDDDGHAWDVDRVRRHLERSVHGGGLLVQRARALSLLSEARIVFREPKAETSRRIVVEGGEIVALDTLGDAAAMDGQRVRPPSRRARQMLFDASRYDRLRVLSTELRRVAEQGGSVCVRIGGHERSY